MKKFIKQRNISGPVPYEAADFRSGFTPTPILSKIGVSSRSERGFTLVETLIAISIFSMSILGLMSVLGSGIANTNYAKHKIAAYYLAQEGIECIRNTRDNYVLYTSATGLTWSDFMNLDVSSLDCPNIDPSFTRILSKTPIPPNEAKIFSTVSWTHSSGSFDITFSENLFNWID